MPWARRAGDAVGGARGVVAGTGGAGKDSAARVAVADTVTGVGIAGGGAARGVVAGTGGGGNDVRNAASGVATKPVGAGCPGHAQASEGAVMPWARRAGDAVGGVGIAGGGAARGVDIDC